MTTNYFADSDTDGNIIGFYNDDIWSVEKIPVTAVPITEAQWLDCIDNRGKYLVDKVKKSLKLAPAPTSTQLLTQAKQDKIAQLDKACTAAIEGTFVSSATGVEHVYSYADKDQKNFAVASGMYNMDSSLTSIDWTTRDAGRVTHTRAQFLQLYKDATMYHLNGKIMKYHVEEAKIQAFTSLSDVQAYDVKSVVW